MMHIRQSWLALFPLVVLANGCSSTYKEAMSVPGLSTPEIANASAYNDKTPYQTISAKDNPYSTWSTSSRDLFQNKRALAEGDILTVQIAINDRAQLTNKSNRNRNGNKSFGVAGSFNVGGTSGAGDVDASLTNSTDFTGNGATARAESINLSVAAAIRSVLPNGNLVIDGSQEVRVNAELRILNITGVVRPSDIQPNNTVSYDRIAEARISYGGKGRISEVQQPAYGHQFLDWLSPL